MKKMLPFLIAFAFIGCKKDDDHTVDLLTRSWQMTAITAGNSTPSLPSGCSQNRIWTFQKDSSFLSQPSPTCTADGPGFILNGKWSIDDNKVLKVQAQGGFAAMALAAHIVTITASKLVLHTDPQACRFISGVDDEMTYEFVPK
jgi:hypothetical protein